MGDGTDITLSSDDVMEVASGIRNFTGTLDGDRLKDADVVPDALAPLVAQPSVPGASAVVDVHKGAREVVSATLRGVRSDLENFATNLERSVEDLEAADHAVEQVLGALPFWGSGPDFQVSVGDDALTDIGDGDGPSEAEQARQRALDERGGQA